MNHQFDKLVSFFDRREKIQLLGITFLMLVGSSLDVLGIGLVVPLVVALSNPQRLLDHEWSGPLLRSVGARDQGTLLVVLSVLILAVFFGKNLYLALQWRVVYGFVFRKMASVATDLLDAYMRASYAFHMQRNSAHLIRNAYGEVQRLFLGGVQQAMALIADLVLIVVMMGLLFFIEPLATLGALFVLATAGLALSVLGRDRLAKAGEVRASREGQMIQWVTDGLRGLKEIRVSGREAHFVDGFRQSAVAVSEAVREDRLNVQYPRLMVETVAATGGVGLLLLLYLSGVSFDNILPAVSLFAVASVRLMPSFSRTVAAINSIRFNMPAVEIVYDEMELARKSALSASHATSTTSLAFEQQIEIQGLCFSYDGGADSAISDVTLTLHKGRSVAFIGSSGAGKTTLVNLVLGLLQPRSGKILVDGVDIHTNISGWQRRIGYIPQDVYLSNDTLSRNIALGLDDSEIDDDALWKALRGAQIAEYVEGLEKGLGTVVGDRGMKMSGGERQRIGIARALYHDPEVLVLDEATASLDYETERDVMAAMYEAAAAKTLIVISHRISTVQQCEAIFLLDSGRIEGSGTFEELHSSSSRFRDLVQAGEMSAGARGAEEGTGNAADYPG